MAPHFFLFLRFPTELQPLVVLFHIYRAVFKGAGISEAGLKTVTIVGISLFSHVYFFFLSLRAYSQATFLGMFTFLRKLLDAQAARIVRFCFSLLLGIVFTYQICSGYRLFRPCSGCKRYRHFYIF